MTRQKPQKDLRILLVDDDRVFQIAMLRMLETLGYSKISTASDLKKAGKVKVLGYLSKPVSLETLKEKLALVTKHDWPESA